MSPREVRAHVAKKNGQKVARRMIVFAKGSDVLSLRLAPYFKDRRPMIRIAFQIAWLTLWIGLALVAYAKIGGDQLSAYSEWQLGPYVQLWEEYLAPFFRGEGAIIAQIATVAVVLFLLVVAFRLSIFLAKFALAFLIAQTLLSSMTTMGVPAPHPYLIALAPFALVWVILSAFIENVGIRQRIRNLFRRLTS